MKRAILALALVAATVSFACEEPRSAPPVARPTPSPSETVSERGSTVRTPKIDNRATGKTARHIDRAISDLKEVGFWRRLTKNLYVVSVGSRPGRQYVPDDGHLAEARAFPYVDDDGGGRLCDITFFPTAMEDDLGLQQRYYDQGLLDRGPPAVRNFWTAILGHELAHCLPFERNGNPALTPEPEARQWEGKVLEAVEERFPNG